MTLKLRRYLKIAILSALGFILSIYGILALGLIVMEKVVEQNVQDESAVLAHSKEPHRLVLLDSGLASFQRRLDLIQNAKRSIELEFFIFDIDEASRLITQALLKKAEEGVAVRIMVDFSMPVFQLRPVYTQLMQERGVQVRYYNTSATYRIISSQHRSHRKLLIIDGETALTGGRNIANDYFDLGHHYNFLDTDLEISGPIVGKILSSFDLYWNSGLSKSPESLNEKYSEEDLVASKKFYAPNPMDAEFLAKIRTKTEGYISSLVPFTCQDLTFVTDFPNHGEKNRKVFPAIVEAIRSAQSTIMAESPYFVIKDGGLDVLKDIQKRQIQLTVLTNSLFSTDADYAVAALDWRLSSMASTGLELYAFGGTPVPNQSFEMDAKAVRWGLHSKRAVLDGKHTLIGTYNLDPRSANLNSELLIICRDNPELAQAVLASMEARKSLSHVIIDKTGKIHDSALTQGGRWTQMLRYSIVFPIANLFDFLL